MFLRPTEKYNGPGGENDVTQELCHVLAPCQNVTKRSYAQLRGEAQCISATPSIADVGQLEKCISLDW